MVVVMGISDHLVEFDCKKMTIKKNVMTMSNVLHIEKVNDDTFLTG